MAAAFYPGTVDPEAASAVVVLAGTELSALDMILPPPSGNRIRGRLVDGATGKPPKSAQVRVVPRKRSALEVDIYEQPSLQYNAATGTFEIPNVRPGAYWLVATSRSDSENLRPEALAEVRTRNDLFQAAFRNSQMAQVLIDMPASNLDDVILTLTGGSSVPIRLSIEGQELSSVKGVDEVRVYLVPTSGGGDSFRSSTRLNTDGAARIDGIVAGEYRIAVNLPNTKEFYVKEIRSGRDDVLYNPLVLSDRQPDAITVLLSSKGGQIEGTLTDAASQPVGGGEVVLIPDQRERKQLVRQVTADGKGHYVFSALPPGGYKIFSWEALEPWSYTNPEVLSRYETQGRSVRVQESAKETVDVRQIPAPKQ